MSGLIELDDRQLRYLSEFASEDDELNNVFQRMTPHESSELDVHKLEISEEDREVLTELLHQAALRADAVRNSSLVKGTPKHEGTRAAVAGEIEIKLAALLPVHTGMSEEEAAELLNSIPPRSS